MIIEAILLCALAPAPWGFIDPLSVRARINTFEELRKLDDLYPQYDWEFILENAEPPPHPWEPTPWVFDRWRIYARRDA